MYRLSLVMCAFLFFAFFGFANEVRQNYRRFQSYRLSTFTPSNHRMLLLQFPSVKSNGGATVSVVTTSGNKCRSSLSFSDQSLTMQSVSFNDDIKPDFKEKYLPLNTVISSSVEGFMSSRVRRSQSCQQRPCQQSLLQPFRPIYLA
ncbi:hypothetical protein F5888DRAFT_1694124 [Russula emetica]|nr:hypothetical protein F5888DRAFT_1694124 [Russula emetica]